MNNNEFLREIAESFNRTPQEILVFISIILSIVGLITILGIIKWIIDRNKFTLAVNSRFEKYAVKYSLTKPEIDLLDRMSRFLKNPLKKYLLLTNSHTFNTCFHLLASREESDKKIQLSIFKKLGFSRFDPYRVPDSSNDIAEGSPAKLISKDKKIIINGFVTRQLPDAIVFESLNSFIGFTNDDEVFLVTHNYTGLYVFKTRILKAENKTIFAAQSKNIVRTQHREYFRKNIVLPILLRRIDSKEEPDRADIRDLSAGGLCVTNPGKKYVKDDDLSLFFHKEAENRFHLYGEVVRVSGNNKILHIKFGHITNRDRDRLVGFIQKGMPYRLKR
ncbi:MAG: PilZ domain-containing protein [Spirochaetales bacterium]|nr:PilZ domain-containing protein [Spirochaetales bacterium]